jgi:hypothetical protein
MLDRRTWRSLTTQEDSMVTDTIMPPVHPEILLTEFLEPLG